MKRSLTAIAVAFAAFFAATGCNDYGNTFQSNTGAFLQFVSPSNATAGGSGFTIQYEGTPNFSYAVFFLFRSMRAVLGDRTSMTSSGGSVNFAPPI